MSDVQYPIVGVVIPSRNRREDLVECLKSLEKQTYPRWFCIVVDDASVDDTGDMVRRSFPDFELVSLATSQGAVGASNAGFRRALDSEAAYVLRLDSDTVADSDLIAALVARAEADPQAGVLTANVYFYDAPDVIWSAGARQSPFHFGASVDHRGEKDTPSTQSARPVDYAWSTGVLIRRAVLEQVGGFDPDFVVYYEEVDFCIRVRRAGWRILVVPQARLWHKAAADKGGSWIAYHLNRSKVILYRKHAVNYAHKVALILYAFAYALWRAGRPRVGAGNRGPLKDTLRGLWAGLRRPLNSSGFSL